MVESFVSDKTRSLAQVCTLAEQPYKDDVDPPGDALELGAWARELVPGAGILYLPPARSRGLVLGVFRPL